MRVGVRDERESAVVGNVQPLVRVGRPRVGALDVARQVAESRRRRSPQPERAVDMEPRTGRVTELRDLAERIEGARVDLPCLCTDDRRAVRVPEHRLERVRSHPALVIDVDRTGRPAAQTEEPERTVDGHVLATPDHDGDRRRACEPVALDVPADSSEHLVPRRGEARDVSHLTTRDERERRRLRNPQQLLEPSAGDLLADRR